LIRTKDGISVQLTPTQIAAIVLVSTLLIASVGAVTYAALSSSGRFGSQGRIVSIGVQVFDNSALTVECTDIDWGDLAAGASNAHTLWIKNNGTIPITLGIGAGDWVPLVAQQYVSSSWSYLSGTIVAPGANMQVTITITVNQYIVGVTDFTNNIYVIATQVS
jgi:hypothetical protein